MNEARSGAEMALSNGKGLMQRARQWLDNRPVNRINLGVPIAERRRMFPVIRKVNSPPGPEIVVDGRKLLNFSTNDYLGLASHPRMREAVIEAVTRYGTGCAGSRLLSGNVEIHEELEELLARYKGGEAAIVFPTGYSANLGIVSAVVNIPKVTPLDYIRRNDIVISDELNHASIIDGIKMSKKPFRVYRHNDMNDLERHLKRCRHRGKLVVTDGVFSMDGDVAPLDKIHFLCRKYNASFMVDDAHGTGVLGRTGKGSAEFFDLKVGEDIDILQGTCSKTFASVGGFGVGTRELIKYLRVMGRSFMFSCAMPPTTAASILTAIKIIQDEPWRRESIQENARYLRERMRAIGFDTLRSETQIVPILIGNSARTKEFGNRLYEEGIYGPAVMWPAVAADKGRIRLTIIATHTKAQIDQLVAVCESLGKTMGII